MKKSNKMQSKAMNNNKVNDCNKVSNKSKNKMNDKSNDIGFSNESKSFQLDDNDEHSFELR